MLKYEYEGSIPAAIALVIFIAITGSIYLTCGLAKDAMEPEPVYTAMQRLELENTFEERFMDAEIFGEDTAQQAREMIQSAEFDTLMQQYSEYLSDFLLTGSEEKAVTSEQLVDFVAGYLIKTAEIEGAALDEDTTADDIIAAQAEYIVERLGLKSAFASASTHIPGRLNSRLQGIINSSFPTICLVIAVVMTIGLIFAAHPRRFLIFLGVSAAAIGGLTIFIARLVTLLMNMLFGVDFMEYLLENYEALADSSGRNWLAAGIILTLIGIGLVIGLMIWRRRNNDLKSAA